MVFVIGLDLEAQPLKDIPHVADGRDGDVEDGDEWDGVEGGGGLRRRESLLVAAAERRRPPVVDCHLPKEQGIPPGVIFPSLVT